MRLCDWCSTATIFCDIQKQNIAISGFGMSWQKIHTSCLANSCKCSGMLNVSCGEWVFIFFFVEECNFYNILMCCPFVSFSLFFLCFSFKFKKRTYAMRFIIWADFKYLLHCWWLLTPSFSCLLIARNMCLFFSFSIMFFHIRLASVFLVL